MRSASILAHIRTYLAEYVVSVMLCLLLAVGWGTATVLSEQGERDARIRAETAARNLAELMSLAWVDTLHRIDYLQYLGRVTSIAVLSGDPQLPEIMQAMREATKIAGSGIIQVSGIDAAGDVIWSTMPVPTGKINLSDREHFRSIAGQGLDRFVGRPVVGAVSGHRTLQFAAAVRGDDRTLRAVTVVSVEFDAVRALERRLARVGIGVITIERSDGLILARSQEAAQVSLDVNDFGKETIQNGAGSGFFRSRIDGVLRFYAARSIPSYGMVLVVGLDADEQMAPAVDAARRIHRVAILLAISLILLWLAVLFALRRQREISLIRQRAAKLEQSEALLRDIADAATDLISLHDSEFRFIYANTACHTLLGLAAGNLIGLHIDSITAVADLPSVVAELRDLSTTGGSRRITMRINHAVEGDRWVESEIVAIERAGTLGLRTYHYIMISRDVTQRVRSEEVRRELEHEFAALAALAPGRLYRITFSSDGSTRVKFSGHGTLFGYPQRHLEHADFFASKMDTSDTVARAAAIAECCRSGHSVVEYEIQAATGAMRSVRDELRLSPQEADKCIIVGYMSDITAERESNERMKQIERLATLGEIASGIAHEMNQPLAIIAMAAENALNIGKRNGDLDPIITRKLQRIMDQAHRVGVVIDRTRLMGRAEVDTHPQSHLADIVQNTMILVQYRLQSAGVNVVVDLASDVPKLAVPAIPLEQVLVNLIINACDAYNDVRGEPQIYENERPIRIAADVSDSAIQIRVADRAGGIPAVAIRRIFDPFFTTKPPGKGTGLGLSICLGIIHDMGGTLAVRNEGGGAVFEIKLPRRTVLDAPRVDVSNRSDDNFMVTS